MKQHFDSINTYSNEFLTVDATRMQFRDNAFDFCVDKGTFDALACGCSPAVLGSLLQEMLRVCSIATILVSSGTPEKRMSYFSDYLDCARIEQCRIELSNLAQLINLLRSELKDKPLSAAMNDDQRVLKKVMREMGRIKREKGLEAEAVTDKRKKLGLMMLKVKHKAEREQEAQDEAKMFPDEGVKIANYNPQR